MSVTGEVADPLFEGVPDKPLAVAQKSLDDANPHATGFALPNTTVHVHAAVEREKRTGHNVVAYLPATMPVTAVAKPWVAIGAHYDHLGTRRGRQHARRQGRREEVHLGADDNASGSAAVLVDRGALAKQPRHRNVLIGFWSGEELGLLGSAAFAAAPPVPLDRLAAYLNFDMVGRMQDNKLTVQATGTSPAWTKLLEQANVPAGFSLLVQDDPYQPTDVSTFNSASVPSSDLLHRRARRLSQAVGHAGQDRLRGPRSRRRFRGGDRPQARGRGRRAAVHQGRADLAAGRRTRRARASTRERFPTTPPR